MITAHYRREHLALQGTADGAAEDVPARARLEVDEGFAIGAEGETRALEIGLKGRRRPDIPRQADSGMIEGGRRAFRKEDDDIEASDRVSDDAGL